MGVFQRGQQLWIRYKGPDGSWRNDRTNYVVGQEAKALRAFRGVVDRVDAGASLVPDRKEALTLEEYATLKWFVARRTLIANWHRDERRLVLHVFPKLGNMPLEDVRARHLAEFFRALRASKTLAPKSIHNVYGVLSALFRDAVIDGLLDSSPCIMTQHQLGENVDADPEWRATALYTREELEALITDERIPLDRRVMYGLQGIGGLRHGEAAGLRWRHFDPTTKELGRLVIATSYDTGRTKTSRPRNMPVHPALAALLTEWRVRGWPTMMGKAPEPDDIVVPTPAPTNKGRRVQLGMMRTDDFSFKRLCADQELLGMRHRRGHDLRRTFITLARIDGARSDILELCTHTPGKGRAIDVYTSFPWASLCAEVSKLRIAGHLQTTEIPRKTSGTRYVAVTSTSQVPEFIYKNSLEAVGIEPTSESLLL